MKNMFKRAIAIASLSAFCASMTTTMATAETQIDYTQYGMGDLTIPREDDISIQNQGDYAVSTADYSDVTVLNSIDLSTSDYFPEIGSQGGIGSCTAWASTYYQFTYEANKLNQIITTDNNTYSPTWTYNLINNGVDSGSSIYSAYDVLTRQGALKLVDCPYNSSNYSLSWSTDTEAMIEALSTRVSHYDDLTITANSSSKITSYVDTQLREIKQYLCAGKVLTVSVSSGGGLSNWSVKNTTNGEKAVYRASLGNSGHALTIVGYDNSIRCDVNGNGTIEASEQGAFKVANSWGDDWYNGGYVWVMYDALNLVSANTTNDWEDSQTGTRTAIFARSGGSVNTFRYIDVTHHEVNLVGLLTLTTNYRYNMDLYTARGTTTTYPTEEYEYHNIGVASSTNVAPYNGTLVLDYGSLDDDIENYLSGNKWFVRILNGTGGGNITNVSYQLVDNKNNLIHNLGSIATYLIPESDYSRLIALNLQLGDVDYDKTLTAVDAQMILNFSASGGVGENTMSDLQCTLADYNQDGVVNSIDASGVYGALSASEAAAFEAFLTEEYNQIQTTAQLMTADMTDTQTDAYAAAVVELYETIVLGQ